MNDCTQNSLFTSLTWALNPQKNAYQKWHRVKAKFLLKKYRRKLHIL
jgi:hypothetical protein